jgi:oligoendopeptidase F
VTVETGIPKREDVPVEGRWNAESVFASPRAWDTAFEQLKGELPGIESFKGRLAEGASVLADWFEYGDNIRQVIGKLAVYVGMAYSTDTLDQAAAERYGRFQGLVAEFSAAAAFAQPELLAVGIPTLKDWIRSDARLAGYEHFVARLELEAQHTRSEEVEELLGAVGAPFAAAAQAHGVLADTDLVFEDAVDSQGERHGISQGTLLNLLGSPDRTLRQSAYEHYADAHLRFKNTMATMLGAGLRQNHFRAQARRYESVLHLSLEPDRLPLSVFESLIETFKKNLPVWHRYWRAKRRMLGNRDFHAYDIFAPLSQHAPQVTFEQSVSWLSEALAPLGEEYVSAMRRGALEQRWVDRALNKGKRLGAFSSGVQGTHPFIMMSYTDDVFAMSTLAHELGHSMHSYFAWQKQPPVYSSYSLFVAEVASNFNQAMLRDYLFKTFSGDKSFEIALIEEAMRNFHRYFFIMPTLARFELAAYERIARGEALTANTMIELMSDLFSEGYGEEVEVDAEREGITWAQFHTHLYRHYYIYQYATGISGAHALAHKILEGEPGAAERYLKLLRAGGSNFPLELLEEAGVDLRTPAPVETTFEVLNGLVERLEAMVL